MADRTNLTWQCPNCRRAQHLRPGQAVCVQCAEDIPKDVRDKLPIDTPQPSTNADTLLAHVTRAVSSYSEFSSHLSDLLADVLARGEQVRDRLAAGLAQSALVDHIPDRIPDFLHEPFIVERIAPGDYFIHVPSFLRMRVGWPVKVGRSFTTYRLNVYSAYGTNGLPEWIREHITLPNPPDITIEEEEFGNYLVVGDRTAHQVMGMFPNLLNDPGADGRYRIRGGDEELYLVRMLLVREGLLLPKDIPVPDTDLWPERPDGIRLRPDQQQGWDEFLLHGRVGLFKPPRGGKSYTGLYACSRIKGGSVVFAPTNELVNQWRRWIDKYNVQDTTVWTYQGALFSEQLRTRQFALAVFDEVHRCPSPEFRKLACLHYKYSLGLSASPFREDGQEAQIYALTGKPVFCDWETHFAQNGHVVLPRVRLRVCGDSRQRITEAIRLVNEQPPGRTLLFVEHLKVGNYLSKVLGVPFWHHKCAPPGGDMFAPTDGYWSHISTPIQTAIVSRIADEGLEISGLSRVIEVESIGDSRRQTIQRFGRLLANTAESEYVILITKEERVKHGKKLTELFSLEGFTIHEEIVTTG